ncbi:MAG: ABC transporter permease [Candidatus Dormibacteria bacterium]
MTASVEAAPTPLTESPRLNRGLARRYTNLTRELAISQFKLRYTGSALGYLWSLFKPAMLFALMYFVFVDLFHVGDHTEFFAIQLLLGIVIWTFFAECTAAAMQSVAGTGHLIRKAYFPRAIMVIAASFTSLLTLAINLVLVLVIAAALHQISLGPRIVAAFPLLIELYLLVLGVALFLSALFVSYRDVGHLWEVSSQALFFGSAVQYPFTFLLNHHWLTGVAECNPVAQIIEDMRHAIVTKSVGWHHDIVGMPFGLVPFLIVGFIFVGGALTFRRLSPGFAEKL